MKSRIQSILLACMALFCVSLASCTDDTLIEVSEKQEGQFFELTVNSSSPASRLELGQDGLSTQWEPGDRLVLIDKARKLAPIFLNCTLTEKSDEATFVSESGVPSGDYYVIYNYNEQLVYGHKRLQSIDNINKHDDLMLWNELTIEEGSSSAAVELKHLYAKVRIVLKNVPSDFDGGQIGMYSSQKGFPVYKLFTSNGLVDAEYGYNPNSMNNWYGTNSYFASNRKLHNIPFGYYYPQSKYNEETGEYSSDYSNAEQLSTLVIPADLSEEDLFFYIISGNTCYEVKKTGVNFKAGTSYKVELDMSQATVSKLNSTYEDYMTIYQLASPADCRHAAYRHGEFQDNESGSYMSHSYYQITQDIDFTDEYFFPIAARKIIGNNKTLSNISLCWDEQDNVGLVRYDWTGRNENSELVNSSVMQYTTTISDLTLENVTFKGMNYVGALGGYNITATNCEVIGNSVIEGYGNYVGGLVGVNSFTGGESGVLRLEDVRVGQNCTIKGKNNVGGIVGAYVLNSYYNNSLQCSSSIILLESCKSEATVTATEDFVGGIYGKMGGTIYGHNSSTSLDFTMEDYTFSLIKCVNEGTVTGRNYVGGIGGDFSVNSNSSGTLDRVVLTQSCNTGNVSGEKYVGGILGTSYGSINICYSIGNISASETYVGGIVGTMDGMISYGSRIANCYSLASLSASTGGVGGIIGVGGFLTISNCYYAAYPDCSLCRGIVGYSNGCVNVVDCLTTLDTIGELSFDRKYYSWDSNHDGVVGPGDEWYDYSDNVTNSTTEVTSILDNIAVINGDNAYSTNIWPLETYPWYCVKFASFSAETNSPDFDDESI